nr:xanthine dehydrogenase family protein subunit M [Nannocystis pusilla]
MRRLSQHPRRDPPGAPVRPFAYVDERDVAGAAAAVHAAPGAMFLAGGTTLVDLMRQGVLAPDLLVDVHRLPLGDIELDDRRARIGACVRNAQLAEHPELRARWPVVGEALLSGMSPQLRNMSTVAGNILQRTRCSYYRDGHSPCNKRVPGSGCAAIGGHDRDHAILGAGPRCIAVFPSDLATALAILDAIVYTRRGDGGARRLPFDGFHLAPGDTPERETILDHGELVTHLELPTLAIARCSHYFKVGDRSSYSFALASAAVALDLERGIVRDARIALGGVATRPWRCPDAEQALRGKPAELSSFRAAADVALAGAVAGRHNGFKIDLARHVLVRALTELAARPR